MDASDAQIAKAGWADLIATLRRRPSRPRGVAALLDAAERMAVTPRWEAMAPSRVGADLWIAPLPRAAWHRGMPKVSVRYVVSADRFRGMFTRHREMAESIYACTSPDLVQTLESGWRRLCDAASSDEVGPIEPSPDA